MGSTQEQNDKNYIKEVNISYNSKELQQFDSNGDLIYIYKKTLDQYPINLVIVYDVDHKEIGSIKEEMKGINEYEYTFYDINKQQTNFIEKTFNQCNGCFSTLSTFTFYDINRNIDGIVTVTSNFCSLEYEEVDKYKTRTYYANLNHNRCDNTIWEYDADATLLYKIKLFFEEPIKIKIYDNNDNEVNLDNKSLFNDGFSKIQFIIILRRLFLVDTGGDISSPID